MVKNESRVRQLTETINLQKEGSFQLPENKCQLLKVDLSYKLNTKITFYLFRRMKTKLTKFTEAAD